MKAVGIFYTDNRKMPGKLALRCWDQAVWAAQENGVDMVYVGQQPRPAEWGYLPVAEVVVKPAPGTHFQQRIYEAILAGLAAAPAAEMVYLVEHDVLYPAEHFGLHESPELDGQWLGYDCTCARLTPAGYLAHAQPLLSCLVGYRTMIHTQLSGRLAFLRSGGRWTWSELGRAGRGAGDYKCVVRAGAPVLDLRWGGNVTGMRKGEAVPTWDGWGDFRQVWAEKAGVPMSALPTPARGCQGAP